MENIFNKQERDGALYVDFATMIRPKVASLLTFSPRHPLRPVTLVVYSPAEEVMITAFRVGNREIFEQAVPASWYTLHGQGHTNRIDFPQVWPNEQIKLTLTVPGRTWDTGFMARLYIESKRLPETG